VAHPAEKDSQPLATTLQQQALEVGHAQEEAEERSPAAGRSGPETAEAGEHPRREALTDAASNAWADAKFPAEVTLGFLVQRPERIIKAIPLNPVYFGFTRF
jgi:hypothetical protein